MEKSFFVLSAVLLFAFGTEAQIIKTIAGVGPSMAFTGGTYGGDGGQATAANLSVPSSVAVDPSGNVYITDYFNHRVRKINSAGVITTIAGNGIYGFSGDGGPATAAQLFSPYEVALDNSGNIYISDGDNNRIRKVNSSGVISTIAGTGTAGYSGDGGLATAAELNYPQGLTVDNSDNLYFVDLGNDVVRKVNTLGMISTIAGIYHMGSYHAGSPLGDGGPATAGTIDNARQIAVDASGNIFIADELNYRIRKVSALGIITTIAGNGTYGYTGDGGPATAAELSAVIGVAVDTAGNVYIGDQGNDCIRMVNTAGIITTIAGNGAPGFSGDGGPATAAELVAPWGVAADLSGNIYIADVGNNRIREIVPITTIITPIGCSSEKIHIYPNPTTSLLTISAPDKINTITITNFLGQTSFNHEFNSKQIQVNVSDLPSSMYLIRINGTEVRKFTKQ